MLTLRELRPLVLSVSEPELLRQLGPFVLVQRPPDVAPSAGTQVMGLPMNARQTMMARTERVTSDALGMLFQFEDLLVATLPPLDDAALSVGRLPDCDLVLDHGSVSKRHAELRWDFNRRHCTLQDLGSTNGTFLNATIRIRRLVALRDGDIVSFGEVAFWYLLTSTLHARMHEGSGIVKVGSHSG